MTTSSFLSRRLSPQTWYFWIRTVAALLLILAAGLKLTEQFMAKSAGSDLTALVVALLEILLGIWTLSGFKAELNHLILVGCYWGFFNIALWKILAGERSCNCFGSFVVSPWIVALLDAAIIIGLAVSFQPSQKAAPISRFFLATAGGAALIVFILGPLAVLTKGLKHDFRQARDIKTRMLLAANDNDEKLGAGRVQYSLMVENLQLKAPIDVTDKKGKSVMRLRIEPKIVINYVFYLRGRELRREKLDGAGQVEGFTFLHPNGALYFDPKKNRAWLQEKVDVEPTPVDPRTWMLLAPVRSYQDWVSTIVIDRVTEVDNETWEIQGRDANAREFALVIRANQLFAPTRISFKNSDGTINRIANCRFRKLPESHSFVPEEVVIDLYGGPASNDTLPKVATRITWNLVGSFEALTNIPDDLFSPVLPAGVMLTSQIKDVRPKKKEPIRPFAEITRKAPQFPWRSFAILASLNVLLCGILIAAHGHGSRNLTHKGELP